MPCTQYLKNQKFRRANRFNWLKDLETIPMSCTEAHVPTPRFLRVMSILVPRATRLICNRFPTTWPRNDGLWGRECVMASTLRMRTTISPRQSQPWTAVSPLLRHMVVRMRKVLGIPAAELIRVLQLCFNSVNWYCFKFIWAHRSIFLLPSPYACRGRAVLQFPPTATTCLRWSWCLKHCLQPPRQVNGL